MKEQLLTPYQSGTGLAIPRQNIYADIRGVVPMIDTGVETSKPPKPEAPKQPEQKAGQETLEKFRKNPVAKTLEQDTKAREGAKDFVDVKFHNKKKDQLKPTDAKVEVIPLRPEGVRGIEDLQKQTPLPVEKYFPEIPPITSLQKSAELFAQQAEGKQLGELETPFLVAHYFLMRSQAIEYAEDNHASVSLKFLAQIEGELGRRGIYLEKLIQEAEAQLDEEARKQYAIYKAFRKHELSEEEKRLIRRGLKLMAGGAPGIPPDGITNVDILRVITAVNAQLAPLPDTNYDGQINALDVGEMLINGLPPTVSIGEKYTALARIRERKSDAQEHKRQHQQEQEQERRREEHEQTRREREQEPGFYGQRQLTDEQKKKLDNDIDRLLGRPLRHPEVVFGPQEQQPGDFLDALFNRMFDRTDDQAREFFGRAFGTGGEFEQQEFFLEIRKSQREAPTQEDRDEIRKLVEKYTNQFNLRRLMHDAYVIAESGQDLKGFGEYTAQFTSEYVDAAFLDSPEVEAAFHFREQILYQIKRENNGWIPYEKVSYNPKTKGSEFDNRTRQMLYDANTAGLFGRELPAYKLDRALTLSRGLGIITLRFPEIVAECVLPDNSEENYSQQSIPWEIVSWELNILDHKIKRYGIAKPMRAILYMNLLRKGDKRWSKKELEEMLALDTVTAFADIEGVKRGIDQRNFFRIGGWATHSSWRSYVAALQEDGRTVNPRLRDKAGLAIENVWNRYEIKDQIVLKREERAKHPEMNDLEFLRYWNNLKAAHEIAANKDWEEAEAKTWEKAVRRIPHVVLRIITDKSNRIMSEGQAKVLLEKVLGKDIVNSSNFQKTYSEVEHDLTLAKEHMLKRQREAPDGSTEEFKLEEDKDYGVIQEDRRNIAKTFAKNMVEQFEKNPKWTETVVAKLADRDFPYAITNEDIPFGDFNFIKTGGRGLITRRINDFMAEVAANGELVNFVWDLRQYKSPDQIFEQLYKIFRNSQTHDYDRGQEAILTLAQGLIRFYEKDSVTKIPLIGELIGLANHITRKGNSYAQMVYGPGAMEWDSDDIYNFTENLRRYIIDDQKKIDQLRKDTGGTFWQAFRKKTKIALYLLLVFASYEMVQAVLSKEGRSN